MAGWLPQEVRGVTAGASLPGVIMEALTLATALVTESLTGELDNWGKIFVVAPVTVVLPAKESFRLSSIDKHQPLRITLLLAKEILGSTWNFEN